jgi:PAS domain-containing protein
MAGARPDLRVLPAIADDAPPVRFCGYCGAAPPASAITGLAPAICPTCELGVLLSASPLVAPAAGDPALVIDGALSVCAVSRAAEELLGVEEPHVVNRHVAELLVPAHAEARGLDNLISLVVSAARGDVPVHSAVVRPAGVFGVRYLARVGACGPAPSAIVVLHDDDV